ncbi:hypothetical protein Tco_0191035, partial [Tanacetum coccineum]
SRTSESTSDPSHFCLNLNDKAADSMDEEIDESRPVGQDRTKRMASTFAARSTSSAIVDTGLVDSLFSKFTQCVTLIFSSMNEASSEYLRIKERELEMQYRRRREEAKLERLKLAQTEKFEVQRLLQRDWKLEMQEKMFAYN